MESQSETIQTVSALKLPMLKTEDYDLWSMRIEQYLTYTDYALWEVIVNGDSLASIVSVSGGAEVAIPPKTTEQKIAKKNELKAKSTMLLAIPDEHQLNFHRIKNAKTLWEEIKTRFEGNKESKKIQKTIIKQQYENFVASRSEEKYVLNNEGKATGQKEVRLVWNNAQRVNHHNFSNILTHPHPRRNFVPTTVITNSGKVPVNTAKHSSPRAATSTSTARYVNTAATRPTMNDYQEIDGGFVAFERSPKGGKISRKGKIRTGKLDIEDTECLVLSPDFKLLDENQVLLKVPKQNNMYSFDLKNVAFSGGKSVFKNKDKATGKREEFVPTTMITNLDKVRVNTAKQSSPRAATSITTRYVNTAATGYSMDIV
nr:ribonuclease H-like domain-containing protein [Tanacetum cinerariifolium]